MGYKDKDQQRKFQREWIARNRANFFNGKSCVRCGSQEQLELDHIDPTKKVSHSIWSWSQNRRDEETAKCQVLCHDCHWEKTRDDFGWRIVHGTLTGYSSYGCRCVECTAANREKMREYRARG